jgi:hypothetical protein
MRIVPKFLRVQLSLQARDQVVSSAMIADPLLDDIVSPALEEPGRGYHEEDGEGSSS